MAIYNGSRYQYSTIDYVQTTPTGAAKPIVFYNFTVFGTISYQTHVYVQGERLDTLSNNYYNRPDFWWAILEANPQVSDPTNITPGTSLRIPLV
jgi:nucleoid-associated protein YgaU